MGSHRGADRDGRRPDRGDPHRFLELPGIYLQCQLACPDFDVVGFAFAGVPGVPHFAQATDVAWAITNAMGDYQDVYLERLTRTGDRVVAQTPDGEQDAQVWSEAITVRGAEDAAVEIVVTENGPVIVMPSDASPTVPEDDASSSVPEYRGRGRPPFDKLKTRIEGRTVTAVSLRSPLLAASEEFTFDAVLDLLFADSIDDVDEALLGWSEPVNRIVIADTAGRVHRHTVGAMPRRASENYWLPVPGWDERYRWAGYHPSSIATEDFDAEVDDVAVIANQRIADCLPLQPETTEAVSAARATRITDLLDADEAVTVDDCETIHRDVLLDEAEPLLALIARQEDGSRGAADIQDRLAAWDRRMASDSVDAYLFAAVRTRLVAGLAGSEAFAGLRSPHGFSPILDPWFVPHPRIAAALPTVLSRAESLGVDLDALVAESLEAVAAATEGGTDAPTWGEHHRFAPIHGMDLMGASPTHPELSARVRPERTPLGGDAECVFANAAAVGFDDQCRVGSAARYVWDLADRGNGRWVVPMGADGDPSADHFQDQLPVWSRGETIPIISDWAALRAAFDPLLEPVERTTR